MAVFRVHKANNFTAVNNYLIKDENLTLKDKGMMLVLLSLPENWEYSVVGLERICKEAKNTINSILNNLERNNYLERNKVYENGKIKEWQYDIYEIPKNLYRKNVDIENVDIEKLDIENCAQLNTNKLNTKELNTNKYIYSAKKFKKPTLEEIKEYCNERNNQVDPELFINHYESNGWKVGKNSMKDWKAAIRTWEKNKVNQNKETRYERERRLLEEMLKDE